MKRETIGLVVVALLCLFTCSNEDVTEKENSFS